MDNNYPSTMGEKSDHGWHLSVIKLDIMFIYFYIKSLLVYKNINQFQMLKKIQIELIQ